MEFFMFYICSIIGSIIIELKLKLDLYKSLADLGYKFKIEKYDDKEEKDKISEENIISRIRNYIPIYNICQCLLNTYAYYNNKNDIITILDLAGELEEMSESEKKKYNKKKTGFQALKMHVDRAKLIDEAPVIELEDGSKITYAFDKELLDKDEAEEIQDIDIINSIIILYVEGRAKYLGEFQQKKAVYEFFNSLLNETELKGKTKEEREYIENKNKSSNNQIIYCSIKITEEKEDINKNKPKKRVRRIEDDKK